MIQLLNSSTIETIKAQQYVQSIYTITKELIENSLDANSTTIKITFTNLEITVEDNGDGISNLIDIGKEGFTSKGDISRIAVGMSRRNDIFMYGFRGTALFALTSICDVEIITNSGDCSCKRDFSKDGIVACAREKGTTVYVRNLFKACDIRRRNLDKSFKADFGRIMKILRCYCLVRNVNFIIYDNKKVYYERGTGSVREYLKRNYKHDFYEVENEIYQFYLSNKGIKGKERQFIFFNDRPVTVSSICKAITSVFNNFAAGNPSFVLRIKRNGDFNVDVDKSRGFLEEEAVISNLLKVDIEKYFSNTQSHALPKMRIPLKEININSKKIKLVNNKNEEKTKNSKMNEENSQLESTDQNHPMMSKSKKTDLDQDNMDDYNLNNKNCCEDGCKTSVEKLHKKVINYDKNDDNIDKNGQDDKMALMAAKFNLTREDTKYNVNLPIHNKEFNEINNLGSINIQTKNPPEHITPLKQHPIVNHTPRREYTNDRSDSDEEDDLKTKLDYFEKIFDSAHQPAPEMPEFLFIENTLNDNIHIEKSDLGNLKVIGQFNKGFILTKLTKESRTYLIIIDQHAADEIYNYETLQRNFHLKKQKLIVPCKLKGNAFDEFLVRANQERIGRNGFEFDDEFRLTAVPIYKNTIFNQEDFWDLIGEINENGEEEFVFCKKLKNILASKACRMSIMIGDGLCHKEMVNVVENLSRLAVPWKCPHGRPVLSVLYVV